MTSKTNWDSKEWLQKELDLIVICNALTDHLYNVPESFLEKNGITKSATGLLDIAGQKSLDQKLGELGAIKSLELGGSGMNTARAAAKVGAKAAFMGLVGQDADGFEVRERLERAGVTSCLYDSAREATGRCTVLVTPDGERTLQTYLGASSEYTTLHTPMREIERAKVFYFTGYQLMTANQSQTIDQCVALANAGEALTAMDVSDPFVVQVCREKILTLLRQNVQIFFANELETKGLWLSRSRHGVLQAMELYGGV